MRCTLDPVNKRIQIAASLAIAAGCVPAEEDRTDAAALEMHRFAVVMAEAAEPRTTSESPRFELEAFFVEATGVDRSSMLSALDAWTPTATDGCTARFPGATDANARVEFLSAGQVGLTGNGDTTSSHPAVFSGGARMTGFAYPDALGPAYAAGETYTVWASGEFVGAFAETLDAPGYVQLIAVDGRELGSATEMAVGADQVAVELFSDSDRVYVSLSPIGDIGRGSIECRFDGVERIEFDLNEVDALLGPSHDLELTVRSASTAPIPSTVGVDGEIQVVFSDRLLLRR